MEIAIDESYETAEAPVCYLCGAVIPTNIFRGSIAGIAHRLALQYDHVIPKVEGGSESKENIKPTHRYCNASKNQYSWTPALHEKARALILRILSEPLSLEWQRQRIYSCIAAGCSRRARSGTFREYCQSHARALGQETKSSLCIVEACDKQARSSSGGFCQVHAKQVTNFSESKCVVAACDKQIQRSFSRDFCQTHARLFGLIKEPVLYGVKQKAACRATHKEKASRSCFFCVEIDGKATYLELGEVRALPRTPRRSLERSIHDAFPVSELAGKHFIALANNSHAARECPYCESIRRMREAWL